MCHRLQDNHVQYTEIVSIRISDLRKVGQDHELHRPICRWMALFVAYKMVAKWRIYLKPFMSYPPISRTHTHAHAHIHTHTPTHTPTHRHTHGQADDSDGQECCTLNFA